MAEKKTVQFGMLGEQTVEIDEDGFIEVPVIVQDSGLFSGTPPAELRIKEILTIQREDLDWCRDYISKLNKETDLPYHLMLAKIKIVKNL